MIWERGHSSRHVEDRRGAGAYALAAISVAALCTSCGRVNFDALPSPMADDGGTSDIDASSLIDAALPIDATPGVPLVVGSGSFPFRMASDELYVYWADYNDGAIHRLPIAGGESTQIVAPRTSPQLYGLTAANGRVYYCDSDTGTIWDVARTGGDPQLLATSPCFDVAANNSHIYWTSGDGSQPALRRRGLDGGVIEDLTAVGDSGNLELRDDDLYWSSYSNGTISRYDIADDADEVLVTVGASGPWGLFAAEDFVYFAEHHSGTGELTRIPRQGGSHEVLLSDLDGPHQVVISDGDAFWTNEYAGTIMHLPQGGGASIIASEQDRPLGIAVTSGAVYWTTRGGDVLRMAR